MGKIKELAVIEPEVIEFINENRNEIVRDIAPHVAPDKLSHEGLGLPKWVTNDLEFQARATSVLKDIIMDNFNLNIEEVNVIMSGILKHDHNLNFLVRRETYDDSYSNAH